MVTNKQVVVSGTRSGSTRDTVFGEQLPVTPQAHCERRRIECYSRIVPDAISKEVATPKAVLRTSWIFAQQIEIRRAFNIFVSFGVK